MSTKKATTKLKSTRPPKSATVPETKLPEDAVPRRMSALDAAATILAESKEPLSAKQMIESMTTQGLWTSPGGKTPDATLYSAILREIQSKADTARFKKAKRGRFVLA